MKVDAKILDELLRQSVAALYGYALQMLDGSARLAIWVMAGPAKTDESNERIVRALVAIVAVNGEVAEVTELSFCGFQWC